MNEKGRRACWREVFFRVSDCLKIDDQLALVSLKSLLMELKRPVKLIKRVKIAHSFLQSLSDQFHAIILGLPV